MPKPFFTGDDSEDRVPTTLFSVSGFGFRVRPHHDLRPHSEEKARSCFVAAATVTVPKLHEQYAHLLSLNSVFIELGPCSVRFLREFQLPLSHV